MKKKNLRNEIPMAATLKQEAQSSQEQIITKDMRNESEARPEVKVTRYGSSIVYNNVDDEFKRMKRRAAADGKSLVGYSDHKRSGGGVTLERQMKRSAGTTSSNDQVFNTFFSPFRQRTAIETPSKRQDLNQWYRFYAKYDPLVGAALDLHSMFPLSNFELEHEDSEIQEFFNQVKDKLMLEMFIMEMAKEFYICGESFPFGFLDDAKDPKMWTSFVLLDPDNVRLNLHRFVNSSKPYTISLVPDRDLAKIVNNGPKDKVTGVLYSKLPPDVIARVKNKEDIPLSNVQVSHFKRTGNYFNPRGESIISRVLYYLMYRDKLLDAQYVIADRHICYDSETECLTSEGWKKYDELTYDSEIATMQKDTGIMEYQKPSNILIKKYKGEMYRFKKDKVVDLLVTPDHRMLAKKMKYVSHGKQYDNYEWDNQWSVMRAKDLTYPCKFRAVIDDFKAPDDAPGFVEIGLYRVPIKEYLEFIGYYLSEGSLSVNEAILSRRRVNGKTITLTKDEDNDKRYEVAISQKITSRYHSSFKDLFDKFNIKFGYHLNNQDTSIWQSSDWYLGRHLEENFGTRSGNKYISTWIKNLPKEYLRILLEAMFKGDGWNMPSSFITKDGNKQTYKSSRVYSTISKQMADDVQEIIFKLGYRASNYSYKPKKKNWKRIYNIGWNEINEMGRYPLIQKKNNVSKEQYDGIVWCPTIPNGVVIVRRNSVISVGLNCPKEFYKIGETGDPADTEEIQAFADMLSSTWTNPNQAIVWHHALQIQWEGASGKILPLAQEFDFIEKMVLAGMGISRAFIQNEGPSYASSSVALDVLISKYKKFREMIEHWILGCVFAPLCEMHKLYKPKKSEIKHRFKIPGEKREPWLPKIIWSKGELRDDLEMKRLWMQLQEKGLVSKSMIHRKFDIDSRVVERNLDDEFRKSLDKNKLRTEQKLQYQREIEEIKAKYPDVAETEADLGIPKVIGPEPGGDLGGGGPIIEGPMPEIPLPEEGGEEKGKGPEAITEGGPLTAPESRRKIGL